ncbi:hypothetical protein DdX_00300 [Ditylenchus destructor]|uniref:Uncharacterized protein n=1 Tax=Ditylenchus destructor TaxID=166010 RepID=A0AAD4NIG7_9BILA|nr:hypothetical protein DdX_00300 [Ditylenchus destructor]
MCHPQQSVWAEKRKVNKGLWVCSGKGTGWKVRPTQTYKQIGGTPVHIIKGGGGREGLGKGTASRWCRSPPSPQPQTEQSTRARATNINMVDRERRSFLLPKCSFYTRMAYFESLAGWSLLQNLALRTVFGRSPISCLR